MPDHAVVEVRLTYALDPEDPAMLGGYKIEWRKPFESQWQLIATEAFAWMHVSDFEDAFPALMLDAILHIPQVLPFE